MQRPCKVCDKKFKTKYTLRSHEKVVHSDKMPFKCSKCDHRFKDEVVLFRGIIPICDPYNRYPKAFLVCKHYSFCHHFSYFQGSMRRHQANDDLHRRLEREKLSESYLTVT